PPAERAGHHRQQRSRNMIDHGPNDVTEPRPVPEPPADWRRLRRLRRRRRHLPPMSVIPTLCTLANLVSGFAAVHYALKPHDFQGPGGWSGLTVAGALVFLGMFF